MSQHALNGNNNYVRTDSDAYRSLRRHHTYYLNGGDLFLLVGQDLFRIHRYFFERDSDYWAKRFQTGTTASPGSEPIGTADNNAIVVQDVQSDELATFLWVFYNPKYSLYHLSVQEWSTILIVASRWSFREAKAFAVRELEKLSMPDIDRVVLYHDHGVDRNLLLRSYSALADRQEPITLEEGMRLGLETSLMLAKAREIARSGELKVSSPSGLKEEEMQDIIIDLFGVVPSVHAANSPVHIGTSSSVSASVSTFGSPPTTPTKLSSPYQHKVSASLASTSGKALSNTFGSPSSATEEIATFGDAYTAGAYPGGEYERPESPSNRGWGEDGGRKGRK